MLPGNSQILTCPFCGKEKEIMSLLSGNTFGSILWSDNKQIAPMLPEISFVQKCPHCKKYYIRTRQRGRYATDSYSFDTGRLSFSEMKEAFVQLSSDGFQSRDEEASVRMMLHHAYNDNYYRTDESHEVEPGDSELFHENGLWLIENAITDNLMKAEYYREIGEMESARSVLDSTSVSDEFQKSIASAIYKKLDKNDCKVFEITRS